MNITGKEYRESLRLKGAKNYQALGRLKSGTMNKLETKYAAYLEGLKAAGIIHWYSFEPANLRLGDKCFYRIDFMVLNGNNALEVHEVKGRWEDDALVKIKVAAEKFPFRFIAIRQVKGEWVVREF